MKQSLSKYHAHIYQAAIRNDKRYLNNILCINEENSDQQSVSYILAHKNNWQALKLVLSCGGNINDALSGAMAGNHRELVQKIINEVHITDPNFTWNFDSSRLIYQGGYQQIRNQYLPLDSSCPDNIFYLLHIAIKSKSEENVFQLLHKYKITLEDAIYGAAACGHFNFVKKWLKLLMKLKPDCDLLELNAIIIALAARAGYEQYANSLLQKANSLESYHMSILGAAQGGHTKHVKSLLNQKRGEYQIALTFALKGALLGNHKKYVAYLIERGANIENIQASDFSNNALFTEIQKRSKKNMRIFVENIEPNKDEAVRILRQAQIMDRFQCSITLESIDNIDDPIFYNDLNMDKIFIFSKNALLEFLNHNAFNPFNKIPFNPDYFSSLPDEDIIKRINYQEENLRLINELKLNNIDYWSERVKYDGGVLYNNKMVPKTIAKLMTFVNKIENQKLNPSIFKNELNKIRQSTYSWASLFSCARHQDTRELYLAIKRIKPLDLVSR